VRGIDAVELEVSAVSVSAAVGRRVVDDDHFVVRVVLGEDRVEVGLDAEVLIVVVARHDQAHRQFLRDFRKLELVLESLPLSIKVRLCRFALLEGEDQVVLRQVQTRKLFLGVDELGPVDVKLDSLLLGLLAVEHFFDPS